MLLENPSRSSWDLEMLARLSYSRACHPAITFPLFGSRSQSRAPLWMRRCYQSIMPCETHRGTWRRIRWVGNKCSYSRSSGLCCDAL